MSDHWSRQHVQELRRQTSAIHQQNSELAAIRDQIYLASLDPATREAVLAKRKKDADDAAAGCGLLLLLSPVLVPALVCGLKGCAAATRLSSAQNQPGIARIWSGLVGFVVGCLEGALAGILWVVGLVVRFVEWLFIGTGIVGM